jgi:hypothetical protein
MDRPDAASGQQAERGQQAEHDAAALARRFAVLVGKSAGGSACRIEAPGRLLRVWSLLQATHEQIDQAALPPEGMARLQRQLEEIRRELESTVSPPLAAELRRVAPPLDEAPSAAGLRIECAVLTSWTSSLTMQMLSTLAAARKRCRASRRRLDQGSAARHSGPADQPHCDAPHRLQGRRSR